MLKNIITVLVAVSIVLAGAPVQAKVVCPLTAKMQMEEMKGCGGCDKISKHESKKSDCCNDAVCNAKCAALGSSTSMNISFYRIVMPTLLGQLQHHYIREAELASVYLNSQERPPKSLS